MKKQYKNPTLVAIKMETQQVIATSLEIGDKYNGTDEIEAREYFFDDYDDEE